MQRLRSGFALPLRNGRLYLEKAHRRVGPGRSFRRKSAGSLAKHQRIGTVESNACRIFEIIFRRIDYREIEAGLQKLQQGIALHDQGWQIGFDIRERFLQCSPQEWQALREISLFSSEPERPPRPGCQETSAIRSCVRTDLPVDRADVFIWRAIASLAIARADPLALLGDLFLHPVGLGNAEITSQTSC